MTWKPKKLTREQMEERRLEGGQLLRAGKLSQAEIARQMGVSRATVSEWAKRLEKAGMRGLRKRKATGGSSKLTREQKRTLKRMLDRGALANGYPTDRWTLRRVGELIQREFGVSYHLNYLNRFLDQLGYSAQKPMPQAKERDEKLVKAWLSQDWRRIKKVAASRRRNRVLG